MVEELQLDFHEADGITVCTFLSISKFGKHFYLSSGATKTLLSLNCRDFFLQFFTVDSEFFSLPLLPKAKRSVGNKESGLDMLGPKIKLR